MFKKLALSLILTLVSATAALAANHIEPQELKELLDKKTGDSGRYPAGC